MNGGVAERQPAETPAVSVRDRPQLDAALDNP
jgi:hypothetical protein